MRTLFDDGKYVDYGQFYLDADDAFDTMGELDNCFAGQENGICGAAVPGLLTLLTGTHLGWLPVVVELHDSEPPVPDATEVVEVSFTVACGPVALHDWGFDVSSPLDLAPGVYRTRYCIDGMAEGRATHVAAEDEPPVEHIRLQFWPAPAAPDRIVRVTSVEARYWHESFGGRRSG